jgi:hypothetical protein
MSRVTPGDKEWALNPVHQLGYDVTHHLRSTTLSQDIDANACTELLKNCLQNAVLGRRNGLKIR